MKTMTCKQLGGACDKEFHAGTFDLKAMNEMMELMKSPESMKEWFENKKKEFNALPEDK
jgi:hypothetical protein